MSGYRLLQKQQNNKTIEFNKIKQLNFFFLTCESERLELPFRETSVFCMEWMPNPNQTTQLDDHNCLQLRGLHWGVRQSN